MKVLPMKTLFVFGSKCLILENHEEMNAVNLLHQY